MTKSSTRRTIIREWMSLARNKRHRVSKPQPSRTLRPPRKTPRSIVGKSLRATSVANTVFPIPPGPVQ